MSDGVGIAGTELPRISCYDEQWRKSLADPRTQNKFLSMLSKVPIFSKMSDDFRLAICQKLRPVDYQRGDVIFAQHEPGEWLGIVLRGEVKCHIVPDDGVAKEIKTVLPGHTVGDINVLGITHSRLVTVTATTPSTLLILARHRFEDAISTPKDIAATANSRTRLTMDAESFSNLDCFKKMGFPGEFASALFSHVERRVLYPGAVCIFEGSSTNEMYILELGQANVEKNHKKLALLSDGASFGMLAALGSQNKATVTCITRCVFTVISGGVLSALLEQYPDCRAAVNHAYVKTLVTHGLTDARQEIERLDMFYGRVHPLTCEEMISRGLGGAIQGLENAHQKSLRSKSKGTLSRPSTARKWPPRKISSRPCSALDMRSTSPIEVMERRCHSSCE